MHAIAAACQDVYNACIQVKALQGSPVEASAKEIISAAKQSWQQLQPIIHKAEESGLIPVNAYTKERIYWGLSMLLSRLARLPARQNREACIPWADFLNHSATANCFLDWDSRAQVTLD